MNKALQSLRRPIIWIFLLFFVMFYPMLVSIYVFLPLFIGIMGYVMVLGIERKNIYYILISLIFMINIEVNITFPYFLTILSVMITYSIFYNNLEHLKKCQLCKPMIMVILIDVIYLGILISYDFIFQISSVQLDYILLYSLIVDMLVVVIL